MSLGEATAFRYADLGGSFEEISRRDEWVYVSDGWSYTIPATGQGGHMTSYKFEVRSFCEGFGTHGNLFLDVESAELAGSIKAFDMVLNPDTNLYEGTAVVRFVARGGTSPLTAATDAQIAVRWIDPPGGKGCTPSITRYPFALTISWGGSTAAAVTTERMTLENYGVLACPVCILDCTLTVG